MVSIRRLMACRMGLKIADVGIHLSLGPSRYQVHVARPVNHHAPQRLRYARVAMNNRQERLTGQMTGVRPTSELQCLRFVCFLTVRSRWVSIAAIAHTRRFIIGFSGLGA